jgi:gamma-glutamylcyclotransferase (GGCT)/AIG2-like uncharacterized protein YtfP
MKDYLFVYGTLRRGYDLQLKTRVAGNLRYIGQGIIGASLYDLGRYPGAVPDSKGDEVIGDVFLLEDSLRALSILDKYEGIGDRESDGEFIRRKHRVRLRSGKRVHAWVYWYSQDTAGKVKIRHKDYLNYLKNKSTD